MIQHPPRSPDLIPNDQIGPETKLKLILSRFSITIERPMRSQEVSLVFFQQLQELWSRRKYGTLQNHLI